jgi:hypothetical protein
LETSERNKYDNQKENCEQNGKLLEPHEADKRYVRRKADGTFGNTVDIGKSLSVDRRTKAKTKVPKGQGTGTIRSNNLLDNVVIALKARRQSV